MLMHHVFLIIKDEFILQREADFDASRTSQPAIPELWCCSLHLPITFSNFLVAAMSAAIIVDAWSLINNPAALRSDAVIQFRRRVASIAGRLQQVWDRRYTFFCQPAHHSSRAEGVSICNVYLCRRHKCDNCINHGA